VCAGRREDRESGRASSGDEGERPEIDAPESESTGGSKSLVTRKQGQVIAVEGRRVGKDPVLSALAGPEQLGRFRELRTRLLAMAKASGLPNFTTLVVSITSGVGASFVARNLAAAFSLEEGRVAILVDCNFHHPTQHTALGLGDVEGGLCDYLERPHGELERLLHPTVVHALHLIPAGNPPAIPREYFSSQAMRAMMTALRQPNCYVFLDAPPTKGAPDAQILAGLADFVVMVVGYGVNTADEIAKASALFDTAKFAGIVFNERS
jgi:protein-tyrosine kinase